MPKLMARYNLKKYFILLHLKRIFSFVITASIALSSNVMFAQGDSRAKVAELLASMPFQTSAQLDKGMDQMMALGGAGVTDMIGMLSAPGKGDNSSLQFALGSYSAFVTKAGREQQRAAAVQAYCNSIDKVSDNWNKEFIIRQLQVTGKDDAVPCLQKFLKQELLSEAAARALAQIQTPASDKALMDGLKDADGKIKLSILEALGYSRYKPAQAAMVALAENSDPQVQKVALYSLARIADPASATTLANAAKKVNYTFSRIDAVASYIYYLQQLAANGTTAQAEKGAQALMAQAKAAGQLHTQTTALKLLVDMGKEKSLPLLYAAMKDTSSKYRAAALGFSEKFLSPAVNKQWLQSMATASPAARAQIITTLSKTGDKSLAPVIMKAMQDKSAPVKLAAIAAAGKIAQEAALPALLDVISKGNAAELNAASTAILTMKGDKIPTAVAAAIPTATSAGKVALIKILAARSADQATDKVLAQLSNTDTAVHNAAVNALPSLAQQKDLPKLFTLLSAAGSAQDVSALQKSIVAASSSVRDTTERAKMIIGQMQSGGNSKGYLLLDVLGAVGGKDALGQIQSSFEKGDDNAQKAAIAALAKSYNQPSATTLLAIARKSAGANQQAAVTGYIQLISKSGFPNDQKLLMLREAMIMAKTDAQRKTILVEVGRCNSFLAMLFAGKYLDDAAVQQEAATAVKNIALANKDFSGDITRNLITKTIEVIKGTDSEYFKTALKKQLAEMSTVHNFVALFNEKDLSGWKGLVADPVKRAKMSADTLAAAQVKADQEMKTGWEAKDGLLIFTGHGNNLCTVKQYGDFEMFVDWKITAQGDAGIYLRGSPQVQIWDTSRREVGAQVGSGGLYNNQKNQAKPLKVADNAVNEWNNFHIIMKGDKVTVYLNGELVTDNTTLENYWDRAKPIFTKAQIELQAHGTYVAYRNIYLRELNGSAPFVMSDEEKKAGFKPLFDGSNLNQWTGNKTDYVIDNNELLINPVEGGNHGNLYTSEEFSDFNFRFEFQLTSGANNGLGIRAPLTGDAAYVGMELQILDNTAEIYKTLHIYQYHGSVYGIMPAKKGFLKPVGEWNYEEVIAKGNNIRVILNNEVILDGDISEAVKGGTADGKEHPGLFNKTGHIGFLGHGSVLRFRNIRIKDLTK